MRRQHRWIVMALVAMCVTCSPAMAAEPYLFDVIKKPGYAQASKVLLDHAGKLPGWTREVLLGQKASYTSGPVVRAVIYGTTYEVFTVCTKEYSCTDTRLVVMFAPNGTQAWGVLVQEGAMSYLGGPSDAQLAVMKGALEAYDAKWGPPASR
jgi:hypothetical protein